MRTFSPLKWRTQARFALAVPALLTPGGDPRPPIAGVAVPMWGLVTFLEHNWNKRFSTENVMVGGELQRGWRENFLDGFKSDDFVSGFPSGATFRRRSHFDL